MENPTPSDFEENVFINCPFDSAYLALLRPLLFTIVSFGFIPKIASERSDSAEQRIDKICSFIEASKYGIHDLSRLKSAKKNEFSRHNMPFELGIDYGSRKFGGQYFSAKKFLVLEKERFDFSRALSDLAGIDIKNHNDDPEDLIRTVRNWFVETVAIKSATPPSIIWNNFNEFMADFDADRRKEGFNEKDIYEMPVPEFIYHISAWIEKKRNPLGPGLGAAATIVRGKYQHTATTLPDSSLLNLNLSIVGGEIYRNIKGKLCGDMVMQSPLADIQKLIEKSGGDREHFESEASELSTDEANPTIFKAISQLTYRRGDLILGVELDRDITYTITTILRGYLKNSLFIGAFDSDWTTDILSESFQTTGTFETTLK